MRSSLLNIDPEILKNCSQCGKQTICQFKSRSFPLCSFKCKAKLELAPTYNTNINSISQQSGPIQQLNNNFPQEYYPITLLPNKSKKLSTPSIQQMDSIQQLIIDPETTMSCQQCGKRTWCEFSSNHQQRSLCSPRCKAKFEMQQKMKEKHRVLDNDHIILLDSMATNNTHKKNKMLSSSTSSLISIRTPTRKNSYTDLFNLEKRQFRNVPL